MVLVCYVLRKLGVVARSLLMLRLVRVFGILTSFAVLTAFLRVNLGVTLLFLSSMLSKISRHYKRAYILPMFNGTIATAACQGNPIVPSKVLEVV